MLMAVVHPLFLLPFILSLALRRHFDDADLMERYFVLGEP